jgi:hypothetical protein
MIFRPLAPHRPDPSEHQLQVQLFKELVYLQHPDVIIVAIPNGGLRNPIVAMQLQHEGVRRGTPDVVVCLPVGRVGWLEMKAKRGSLSDYQIGFRTKALKLGHLWGMARTVAEALEHLRQWGALR